MLASMLAVLLAVAVTFAATAEQISARLAEVAPHRELRTGRAVPPPSDADLRRAASGAINVSVAGQRASATTVVNMPIGKLWAGLNDETRHPGYTAVGYSELVKGRPCTSGRAVFQHLPIPVPFVDDRWWVGHLRSNANLERATGNSVRELTWKSTTNPEIVTSASGKKMISASAPLGYTTGSWFLVAIDPYTTWVEYASASDPGEGVPTSVTSRLAAQGVRDQILAIQKFSRSGNPVCPVY